MSGEQQEAPLGAEPPSPSLAVAEAGEVHKDASLAEHLEGGADKGVYAIMMPPGFVAKEGAQLAPGVRIGTFLGAGAQAKVFRLAKDDGSPTGKVIKINHADLGSKMLNNNVLWVGLDLEWGVGVQLRSALHDARGDVPGFMQVCDCLITGANGGGKGRFAGMIMGELHGWEVYKRMQTDEFYNISYVREMLFQVFSALDRAQRTLGFVHADLGMRNVMEHYPTRWEDVPAEESEALQAEFRSWGPGLSTNADGSRFPLGPDIEFKIIDFGIAKFSPKMAAAAGGQAAQEVVEELHRRVTKQERIIFGNELDPAESLEVTPGAVVADEGAGRPCLLGELAKSAKFRMQRDATAFAAAASATASAAANTAKSVHRSISASRTAAGPRVVSLGKNEFEAAVEAAEEGRNSPEVRRQRRKQSPIEAFYRSWWHRKGDVFHLLLTMALALDDRTWREQDMDEVLAYLSLTHHVTGIRMQARFAEPAEAAAEQAAGRFPYGRHKWHHWFRRWHIRLKAHVAPYNSGLLAREALSHPFFGAGRTQHATVPWRVGMPRWDPAQRPGAGSLLKQSSGVRFTRREQEA